MRFKLLMSIFLLAGATAWAQGVDHSILLNPPANSWPLYHGTYDGQRHSKLEQITPQNVHTLSMAWAFQIHAKIDIKSSPLLVDGVIYFTVPDNVWAIDALSGHQLWHYSYPPNPGLHIGSRGVGMYKNWLYFLVPDGHLISLNANDGSVRWKVQVADVTKGYWTSMAPLVVGNHVLVGTSGDFDNLVGYIRSVDPKTGEGQWQWTAPPPLGTSGATTGGNTWMTGTYDPDLNLAYWGTGNPTPVLTGATRPGDNLYTCSIVALNPDTGKLAWAFQPSPHDVHDWDAVQTPILFDAEFKGKQRKLLAQASRNGFFFVLDRTSGEHLVTSEFIDQTWASGVDSRGRPIAKPSANPSPDGALVEPGSDGATNWMAPSFDPQTDLFYVMARRIFSVFYKIAEGKTEGWGGRDRNLWANTTLRALDYQTGKVMWNHELGEGEGVAGILTTAGHLLFSADTSGNILALDPATGKTLWHLNAGGEVVASPMTYQIDGRQYLIVPVQDVLYAFGLPEGLAGA